MEAEKQNALNIEKLYEVITSDNLNSMLIFSATEFNFFNYSIDIGTHNNAMRLKQYANFLYKPYRMLCIMLQI